jgi:hypothetical protein
MVCLMDKRSDRLRTGSSAAVLAFVGLMFLTVLVADPGDDAYLVLLMLGGALIVSAIPYAAAALLPDGRPRRASLIGALVLSLLVGTVGTAILVCSLLAIGLGDYRYDPFVLRNHVIALGAFVAIHGALFLAFQPGFSELVRPWSVSR